MTTRRDFLKIIGTVIGSAVAARYLPTPLPIASDTREPFRVLSLTVEHDPIDVTSVFNDGWRHYAPGSTRWYGEAELDLVAAHSRDVRAWLSGMRPIAIDVSRGSSHIRGQAVVTHYDAKQSRVTFYGTTELVRVIA